MKGHSRIWLRGLAAVVLLAGAGVAGSAGAQSPDDSGWWSRAQTPTTPPGVAPPPTVPAPPTQVVPEGGLVVAMAAYSDVPDPANPPPPVAPVAIAALRFSVPEGAESTLSLSLADGYDADGPPAAPHPPFLVDACVPDISVPPWDPPAGANGRWEDRPVADCSSFSVSSTVEEDGQRLGWVLPPQFQVSEGLLDVILVPRGVPDPQDAAKAVPVAFTLVFDPPDEQTLFTEGGVEEEAELEADDFAADFGLTEDGSVFDEFGFVDDFTATDLEGIFDENVAAGRTGTATGPRRFRPAVGVPAIDDRVERVLAVAVLFALATALWWIGGQPVRPPRLLGSVGSGAPAAVPDSHTGGVGRFARSRVGRPPQLG